MDVSNPESTHPFADYEPHIGPGSVSELDQSHQVLIVDHLICRVQTTGKKMVTFLQMY